MQSAKLVLFLGVVALGISPAEPGPLHAAEVPADPDEQLLREAKIATDDAGLLAYLQRRSGNDADLQRLEALVRQLGSASFAEREQASARLISLGLVALPALRQARADKDVEVARRAAQCADEIVKDANEGQPLAAVRLLVRRGPAGAAEGLLRYLPYAVGEELEEEIWFGLDALAARDGTVRSILADGLKDSLPARRGVAACILGRRGDAEQRQVVQKLLADAVPMVRLRAAQGLLAGKDQAGIPTLVELLNEPSVELAWQAEELLHWVTGDDAPEAIIGTGSADARQQCRKAWEAWWRQQGAKVDFAKIDQEHRRPGLLLAVHRGHGPKTGRIWVCGCDGKPRWELTNLPTPAAAELTRDGSLLVMEERVPTREVISGPGVQCLASRLAHRDLNGELLWQYDGLDKLALCQNVLTDIIVVVSHDLQLVELNAKGQEVSRRPLPKPLVGQLCNTIQTLKSGRLTCMLTNRWGVGDLVELETKGGRIVRKVSPHERSELGEDCSAEMLPNGNYLVVSRAKASGALVEIDSRGETVWRYMLPGVLQATRLRNGDTIAVLGHWVVALDSRNRLVWDGYFEAKPDRVLPCLGLLRLGFDRPSERVENTPTASSFRIEGLNNKQPATRLRSIAFLSEFGSRIPEAVPALTPLLNDPDQTVREKAKHALDSIVSTPFAKLLQNLKHSNPEIRAAAIWQLRHYTGDARVIAPLLIPMLKDKSAEVRGSAANILGGMTLELHFLKN